jgi:hypothetical protein
MPDFLNYLQGFSSSFTCRFPKSRKIILSDKQKVRADKVFENQENGSFYYYHNNGFVKTCFGTYSNIDIQLVVIANNKKS